MLELTTEPIELDALVRDVRTDACGAVVAFAGVVRLIQTGHLYWYALVMILGVFGLLTWQLWPYLLSVAH